MPQPEILKALLLPRLPSKLGNQSYLLHLLSLPKAHSKVPLNSLLVSFLLPFLTKIYILFMTPTITIVCTKAISFN